MQRHTDTHTVMGNVGGYSHSCILKAKTRLLVLKMGYGDQSGCSALPPLPVCSVTIATALSLAEADFSQILSCRITDAITLQTPAESFCSGDQVSSTALSLFSGLIAQLMNKICPWFGPCSGLPSHTCHPCTGFGCQEHPTPSVANLKKITSGPGFC